MAVSPIIAGMVVEHPGSSFEEGWIDFENYYGFGLTNARRDCL